MFIVVVVVCCCCFDAASIVGGIVFVDVAVAAMVSDAVLFIIFDCC